jgi:pentatricopeptide repeat protein
MAYASSSPLIAEAWAIFLKVLETSGLEIIFFVATVAIAVMIRRTNGRVSPPREKAKQQQQHRRTSRDVAQISRGSKLTGTTSNAFAQLAYDSITIRCPTATVLSRYAELRQDGKLPQMESALAEAASPYSMLDLYQSLMQCACRGGQVGLVFSLLDDMETANCKRSVEFYECIMRMLAAKKCFREALAVNDRLEREGIIPSPVTLSCLVGFAAELGMDDKTIFFFNRLLQQGAPSVRACTVILRLHGKREDWPASVKHFELMLEKVTDLDSLVLNIVLATGVAAGKLDEVLELLSRPQVMKLADTVSFNTLLKGFAQSGKIERAVFLVKTFMKQQGIKGNIITYNTLIDAAVRAKRTDIAWCWYAQLREAPGLWPDKCTCSTLVKALQQRPKQEEIELAIDLVGTVVRECPRDLRGRLLTATLNAAIRSCNLHLTLKAQAALTDHGFALSSDDAQSIATLQARKKGS